jgi:multidrug efflux pump subunit AcrB
VLRIGLRRGSGLRVQKLKDELREQLPRLVRSKPPFMKDVNLSFEAGDVVAEVMSFGSPAPVEVSVNGPNLADNRAYAAKVYQELEKISALVDLQYVQSFDYPTLDVTVDREKAGLSGVTAADVGNALAPATLSSRFTKPLYWRDAKTNIAYQVQVELPASKMTSATELGTVPIKPTANGQLLVRDVAAITEGKMPGQIDAYNMRATVSMSANIRGDDLGRVAKQIDAALLIAGQPPRGAIVEVRGQVAPMKQMFGLLAFAPPWQVPILQWFGGLTGGLFVAVVAIFLLLTAYFQSVRLALIVVSTAPIVVAGVFLALMVTRTTLNIQSFMGAIMAIGVAVANAILLVTFAERARRSGIGALEAAVDGARHRLRPILMTSCAMIAGMLPMALGIGEGGEQTAPLARAVIGGLALATLATLMVLPSVFAVVQARAKTASVSLDPDDRESVHYDQGESVTAVVPANG